MITYRVIKNDFENSEIGSYTSYGICAYNDEIKNEIYSYSDVFLRFDKAVSFAKMCNELQLDVVHLPNVIEDYLQSIQ